MARAHEMPPLSDRARQGQGPKGLPPVKTFFALLALVGIVTAIALTRSGGHPTSPSEAIGNSVPGRPDGTETPRKSGSALSTERAISLFTDLRQDLNTAIRQRDVHFISRSLAKGSTVWNRARRVVLHLQQDDVIDKTRLQLVDVVVLSTSPSEIRVREIVVARPCFVTEQGRDVSKGPGAVRQVGLWTLEKTDSKWRITDGYLSRDHIVEKRDAACP